MNDRTKVALSLTLKTLDCGKVTLEKAFENEKAGDSREPPAFVDA